MTEPICFSVIIANYNGGDYLKNALKSLQNQTVSNFEVFIVDNASDDNSMEAIFSAYGSNQAKHDITVPLRTEHGEEINLHLRPQSTNLGFAAANNLAAKQAIGDWLVLLNPDAEASPNWLETLAEAAHRYPHINMFASAQIDLNDQTKLDGAGDAYLGFGIPWRGGFGRPRSELPIEGSCFSPCGASAMFKRTVFLEHNGFDERFFCYCEDVDLGYRLRLAGERCVFLPDAVIKHAGGGVSGRESEFALYHGSRNRLWTYLKNTPLSILIPTLPVHIALMLAILFRNRKTEHFSGTLKGLRAGIAGLGPIWRDRKTLKSMRHASLWTLMSAMCWNPFILRARKPHIRPIKTKANT